MHKQDFNHIRQLFQEIFEKDQTIKQLKVLVSQSDAEIIELRQGLNELSLRNEDLSKQNYELLNLLKQVRQEKDHLIDQMRILEQTIVSLEDHLKYGPPLSDQEILAWQRRSALPAK